MAVHSSAAADAATPDGAAAVADAEEAATPDSPTFDESFAMDAQLVLGGLVTPATALRPDAVEPVEAETPVAAQVPLY